MLVPGASRGPSGLAEPQQEASGFLFSVTFLPERWKQRRIPDI